MSKPVVIVGAGDLARLAHVFLTEDTAHEVAAFAVHDAYRASATLLGKPIVALERLAESHPAGDYSLLVAVGYSRVNQVRAALFAEVRARGYELISYVSPRVRRWSNVTLGANCLIFDNVVIEPFATLGDNVVVWSGCQISHDTRVGDHCFLAPRVALSGNVTVGEHCFLGLNSTVRDGVTIAPSCVIGAGALVLQDTETHGVYKGRPAEKLPIPSHRLSRI